ncbi:MAG: ATP-binding protein [Bdellovibrionia bacterium]
MWHRFYSGSSQKSSIKRIFADPARLQQILWNLISNSIKFSSQNGKIWISLIRVMDPSGERIQFEIRDNGKGIKSDFLPIIFDRFTQADSSSTRVYGGLGLGLAIVKKLVEMHDGNIKAESSGEDKGATFIVSLPVQLIIANTIQSEINSKAITLLGLKVLLVDDEADAREVFTIMLQSFGAEVKTAGSAQEALAIVEEYKPDVLVSDIAMPDEDGCSLISKIRSQKSKIGQTPALALTAYARREDIERAHLAGFQAHVAKPMDANVLALAISKLVR